MDRPLRLLIQGSPESTRIALLDETRLLEFYQEDTGAESLVDSVFLGRVERVLPDVKAAFVKLGLRQNGFLPLREAESYHRASGSASLMTGQDVLVQVKKDPKGEKGAFLTRDIGLPGQYVLLMPKNRFVGLSRRVTGEEDRARAQAHQARGPAVSAEIVHKQQHAFPIHAGSHDLAPLPPLAAPHFRALRVHADGERIIFLRFDTVAVGQIALRAGEYARKA